MGVHRPRRAWLGFVIGAFFSLMSSSFAYEDPLLRQSLSTQQKARAIFKEMGQGMYKSGKGFGKVGALFAGIECVIESVSFAYQFPVNDSSLWGMYALTSIEHETIWSTLSPLGSSLAASLHETPVQKRLSAVASPSLHFLQPLTSFLDEKQPSESR